MNAGDNLRSYVEQFDGIPVTWGVDDCAPFAGRWVELATGRGLKMTPYSTMEGGQDLIRKYGSLVALCDDLMSRAGLYERYGDPCCGDVGVVHTSRFADIAGIFATSGHFLWRHMKGVSVITPRRDTILKVWAVNHGD